MSYQTPTPAQAADLSNVRYYLGKVREILSFQTDGRVKSIALTELEAAEMWINKVIMKGDNA